MYTRRRRFIRESSRRRRLQRVFDHLWVFGIRIVLVFKY